MTARVSVVVAAFFLLAALPPFRAGVREYREGNMKAAAASFRAAGDDPTASYDAGLAELRTGKLDAAITSFEAASVRGEGDVKSSALVNLALCHVKQGDATRAAKPKKGESREDRMKRLGRAARSYRTALALFRRVPPPSPDADLGAKAAKVRLLSTLDVLQKLAADQKKQDEEKALSHPGELVLRMLTEERDRRRQVTGLTSLARRHQRLPARRIRKAEFAARQLLEKLAARLVAPPPSSPGTAPGAKKKQKTAPLPVSPAAKAAAAAIRKATKAMGDAEGRLDGVDLAAAAKAETRAIAALTTAALSLPIHLPSLVSMLKADQDSLLSATKGDGAPLVPAEEREMVPFLGAITRLPGARKKKGEATLAPKAHLAGNRRTARLAPETVTRIRQLAQEALAAAEKAADLLEKGKSKDSIPDQKVVSKKLDAISDLLPKPPEGPAEKLRDLLSTQDRAKKAVGALTGMNDAARKEQEGSLAMSQTTHGREADAIAAELSKSRGKRERLAAPDVEDAAREIHGSSEDLRRDRTDPAGAAIDRDRKAIQEAIDILSGKKSGKNGEQSPNPSRPKNGKKKEQGKKKGRQDARELSPREARRLMEQMDQKRRDVERKLFPGGGQARVDKDW